MEYISLKTLKFYPECAPLVEGLGYYLVDLKIVPGKSVTKISAVITPKDPSVNMGVNDCAKVHRALLPRLEALLGTEETTMELSSTGIEHNIRNAAEFEIFTGRQVRVWDETITDWVGGKVLSADTESVTLEMSDGIKKVSYESIKKAKFIHN